MNPRSPILVIGAHRSGTSAVAQVLEAIGVFVGRRLDPNHESTFFLGANEWLLRQCGGRWDHPGAVRNLLADDDVRGLCVEYLDLMMSSPRAVEFLGLGRYLRHRSIRRLREPWGFKDPRTTFTLPLWTELFPDARVIHVHRHGVDVANSLVRRHRAHLERSRAGFRRHRTLLRFFRKRAGFGESVRCSTLAGAFDVWEEYVARAHRQVTALGERGLEVAYEDLAARPRDVVGEVARFCELRVSDPVLRSAAKLVRGERASAHERDPELSRFAASVADRVARARGGRAGQRVERPNHSSTA